MMKRFNLAALLLVAVLGFSACTDVMDLEHQIATMEEQMKALKDEAISEKDLLEQLEAMKNANSKEIDALMKSVGYTGVENGHFYVDLGLTSGNLWAACNVGANVPTDYGDYFAWGLTKTQETFFQSEYKLPKYNKDDNLTELELEDDAAATLWQGKWRMPSQADFEELILECKWVWNASKHGYEVRSKKNTNTIFIPTAGYYLHRYVVFAVNANNVENYGKDTQSEVGSYWSRTVEDGSYAKRLYFKTTNAVPKVDKGDRYAGRTIRPVISKAK